MFCMIIEPSLSMYTYIYTCKCHNLYTHLYSHTCKCTYVYLSSRGEKLNSGSDNGDLLSTAMMKYL